MTKEAKPKQQGATKRKAGRRLGRGLGSLISAPVAIDASQDPPKDSPAAGEVAPSSEYQNLPLGSIVANARQPRKCFDEAGLEQLAASIRESGLIQPIVVRPTSSGFELIAGERRLRAYAKLGRETIPAIVRDVDDREAAAWALVENLQREDLAPLERAEGISCLMADFGLTQAETGERLALDRATIANLLRLLDLDPKTREALEEGLLTQGHARALLGCADLDLRERLLGTCVRKGWSVRETERQVKRGSRGIGSPGKTPRSPHVDDLEERLEKHLGTKVHISLGRKKGTGRMMVEFFSLEQFDGLLERLGFNADESI